MYNIYVNQFSNDTTDEVTGPGAQRVTAKLTQIY
jgi:hypothetical protein